MFENYYNYKHAVPSFHVTNLTQKIIIKTFVVEEIQYISPLVARDLLYALSDTKDNTYHDSLCTSWIEDPLRVFDPAMQAHEASTVPTELNVALRTVENTAQMTS